MYNQQQSKRARHDGPRDPIPRGWRECPPMGDVSDLHPFIPCKVPLGQRWAEMVAPHGFTPADACALAHSKLEAFAAARHAATGGQWVPPWAAGRWDPSVRGPFAPQLAVIIDLTNTSRYYRPDEVPPGVAYVKVPCVGRDASPEPLAVNQAAWEVQKALLSYPETYFVIHCTHGFNRTGYVIACLMMRLLAATGMCVERAARRFAAQRPPGIYKHQYLEDLFKYHHEARPAGARTPAVPEWKGPDTPGGDDDDGGDGEGLDAAAAAAAAGGGGNQQQGQHMSHDDKFGEVVPDEEREWLANQVYDAIVLQGMPPEQRPPPGAPPPSASAARGGAPQFAGSQPVSLDREKLAFVRNKRYWVTWKADGTRYLLLLTGWGVYMIDRACDVRRVQMRFPTALAEDRMAAFRAAKAKAKRPEDVPSFPVGPPHAWTLMDGEMVVDEVDPPPGSGAPKTQRRRYLAYDLMVLNGEGVMDLKFGDRHLLIEREVAAPRGEDARWMGALPAGRAPLVYQYAEEPFGFRRKEFYQLHRAEKLLRDFIPRLCHESDGLILQPHDDPYIPRTCDDLLKWKFDHLNSVDFKLEALPGREPQLLLNYGGRRTAAGGALNQHRARPGVRLIVRPGFDPSAHHGRIVECSYNREERGWEFMRERADKATANHISVFDKVVKSIEDDLQEADLLAAFEAAYAERPELYDEDARALHGGAPAPRRFVPVSAAAAPMLPRPQQQQHHHHGGWGGAPPPPPHHHQHHYPPQQQHWQQQPPHHHPPPPPRQPPPPPPAYGDGAGDAAYAHGGAAGAGGGSGAGAGPIAVADIEDDDDPADAGLGAADDDDDPASAPAFYGGDHDHDGGGDGYEGGGGAHGGGGEDEDDNDGYRVTEGDVA